MKRGFTLIELIVVIIIVGILAALGISQYSLIVEKGRTAEARVHLGTMRQLAQQYWLDNGNMTNIQNADVGVDGACHSSDFYIYWIFTKGQTYVDLNASNCVQGAGGKSPNGSRNYWYAMRFHPDTGQTDWYCRYGDDQSPCFGLPSYPP